MGEADETGGSGRVCPVEGCCGLGFRGHPECFAHLGDGARSRALQELGPGSAVDLSGTVLSPGLVRLLVDAVRDPAGTPTFGPATFAAVTFTGRTDLSRVVFERAVRFDSARFDEPVSFRRAQFRRAADFTWARFCGLASFDSARFEGIERFGPVHAEAELRFDRATFARTLTIDAEARDVSFSGTRFESAVVLRLQHATAWLDSAFLSDTATVVSAQLQSAAYGANDRTTTDHVPTTAAATRAAAGEPGRPAEPAESARPAPASRPAPLRPASPDAPAASPASPASPDVDDLDELGRARQRELSFGTASVGSLRGVDASRVVLSGVDLSLCRLAGAYNLDKLRIEGRCTFAGVPQGVRFGMGWPPVWWWTRRQTIIEEHRWRARRPSRTAGWAHDYPERPQSPASWLQPTHPERLAVLYRQLRKAFEDAKNEPGAADFYYGEMEMRRHSPTTPRSERFILWLYWLLSGYGLRAGRALLGLAALVGLTTWLLGSWGFASPTASTEQALRAALDAVVFRTSAEQLTTTGAYVEMAARVVGPILLALAALSVRNRVRR